MTRVTSFLYLVLTGFLIGYVTICAVLFFFQRAILYKPATEQIAPHHYGLYEMQELTLTSHDGTKVKAWYKPAPKGRVTMVYYHGNAGNLADRTEKLQAFMERGIGILALSYRGYGNSEGKPTEQGIYQDARAAINYLYEQGIAYEQMFIYGESLGSGVAVQMATEYDVKAIVLEAPYTSITNRGYERYPLFPIKLLLKDKFDSLSKISSVKEPVLIFHGYRDEVMPIHHGRRLLQAANEPKEARFFDHVGHTEFDLDEISRLAVEFSERSLTKTSEAIKN